MHNLTVEGIHTYYVLAGDEAVLVHNTNCAKHARELAKNLTAQGVTRPAETAAHHIVASGAKAAKPARDHLVNVLKMNVDEAANGVYLPRFANSPNPGGAVAHSSLSNNAAYYNEVNRLILQTKTAAEARTVLADIGRRLLAGKFP